MSNDLMFRIITECFIKRTVCFATLSKLSPESYDRFVNKMVILISRDYFPKRDFGLERNSVRSIFEDVLRDLRRSRRVDPKKQRIYVYKNYEGEPRLVFARSKKDALSKIALVGWTSYGAKDHRTIQRISSFQEDSVVTDKGESVPLVTFDPWAGILNLYGNGVIVDE